MMFWGNHMGGGWNLLLTGVLWIGIVVLGIWLLTKLFPASGRSNFSRHAGEEQQSETTSRQGSALEILQRRYARGEITKEEYETIRHDLAS
jgi:putative membrane protein